MNDLANISGPNEGLRELALFAGAGGGILGGHLLGWQTICAVERDAYAAAVLAQRQNDGLLAPFPIWSDVCSFDGRPWRGLVDVVSGGFPCQDISAAGKGAGIDGERSGMWREMARIIGEVRPRFVFVENSPMLVGRGLTRVIGDLASLGYDTQWCIVSAQDLGAPHKRDRIWIKGTDTTPAASDATRGTQEVYKAVRRIGHKAAYTLPQYARDNMYPTPQASDNRDRGNLSSNCVQRRIAIGKQISLSQSVSTTSGKLNPTWVEWLMGWPLGWTDLKPLEMGKFQLWQQQHLIF